MLYPIAKGAGAGANARRGLRLRESPPSQLIAAAVGRYAGKCERLPVDREVSTEFEKRARLEGISWRDYLDRLLRKVLSL